MAGWVAGHRKAITGAAVAFVTALVAAWSDGTISGPEWGGIVLATLAGGGLVYQIPNDPGPDRRP